MQAWRAVLLWLGSTPKRTFVVFPVCIAAIEAILQGGRPHLEPWGLALLAWGFLQYYLVGRYRIRLGRGGPGSAVPPDRLVTEGPYRHTRNPMYLGHLIFMLGLAITFRSWLAFALLLFHIVWFHRRVLDDEERLKRLFGADYERYMQRVKRWIPGVA